MSLVSKILDLQNPVFCGYVTYGSVLVLKMMIMSPMTGRQRIKNVALVAEEDHVFAKGKTIVSRHEDVERIRRAHRNDMENIPIYFIASFAYMLTDPDPTVAINLFRVYTAARCIHTFVYAIYVVPQPARALSWFTGYFITGYMAVKAILHFKTF